MNTKGSVNAPRTITTPQGLATPTTHLLLALREYPAPAPTQCDISVGKPRVQKFDEPVIPPAKTRPPSKLDLQNNRQSEVIEASTLSRLRPDAPSFIPSSSSGAYLSNRTLNARAPSFLPAHLRPREGKIEDVSTRPEPNRLRMAQGAPSSCVNSNPPGLLVSTKALCVSSLRSEYHDDIDNV
ncbi:hypothetical protein B0H34DRAFT_417455 [Crassisporium funariophilum]|nr:hypothetical protein B0H34DRAFT_417455 [Crassisporium funariophilum]